MVASADSGETAAAATTADGDWPVFRGDGTPHDGIERLPAPPPWREFGGGPVLVDEPREDPSTARRLGRMPGIHRSGPKIVDLVNTALFLRRPLLVTGKPGTGKSTLAYSIAHELRLGAVLEWAISSHSTLTEGLYSYDAVGRLQEAALHRNGADPSDDAGGPATAPGIGRYLRMGPLGTALLPRERPRVLLIDELDKADVDLPNDLLHVLEDGKFEIPQLSRLPDEQATVEVMVAASADRVPVRNGMVECRAFPMVVITSNGEREFPPAFLRRCLRLDIDPPKPEELEGIIAAQLGQAALAGSEDLINDFLARRGQGDLSVDQLLNAIYLTTSGTRAPSNGLEWLLKQVMRELGGQSG